MRMRAKKNRNSRLEQVNKFLINLNEEKLDYNKIFNNSNEKHFLEIGCGKGKFITELSKVEPDANMIGVEKVVDVLLMAMEKARENECSNIRFINTVAEKLDILIPEMSIDRLYMNFSDPWPKKRNAKRRLTSPVFLEKYKHILKSGSRVYFKTDNRDLFDYSVGSFKECGYELNYVTYDLHSDALSKKNIMTEYEKVFSQKGFKINYLEAVLK